MGGTTTVGMAGTATVGTAGADAAACARWAAPARAAPAPAPAAPTCPSKAARAATETNPGKGNGFFPATILPSHAKTAYTTWKTKYLKTCSGNRFRVAFNADETVSEGIGYGMILTVAHGDRAEFDGLWAYYKSRSSGGLMGWKASGCDSTTDPNSASDADLDAAMGLIQAACKWGGTYLTEATTLIANIKAKETIEGGDELPEARVQRPRQLPKRLLLLARLTTAPSPRRSRTKPRSGTSSRPTRTRRSTPPPTPRRGSCPTGRPCRAAPAVAATSTAITTATTPRARPGASPSTTSGTAPPPPKTYLAKLVTWVDGPAGGITAIGDKYTLSGTKESVNHNSTFTGAFALAAMSVQPREGQPLRQRLPRHLRRRLLRRVAASRVHAARVRACS